MSSTKSLRQAARRLGLSIGANFFHAAQCGICPICDKHIDLRSEKTSFDHVHPLKEQEDGVNLHQGNLLLVHDECNREKGNRPASHSEIIVLAMVNDVLGFCEATGEYARRSSYLKILREKRQAAVDQIVQMEEKFERMDRERFVLERVKYDQLHQEIAVIDDYIDDQLGVFKTYEFFKESST